jgi:DNA-binding MarR family transcriptional regulator
MSIWQAIVYMATVEFKDLPANVLAAEEGQRTSDPAFHDKLQVLFVEVAALANQLRRTAASVPRQAHSPIGGWGVLQILDRRGPLTVPAIARIRTVSRQSIQTLINRLESHGYVSLAANPAHKKSGLVHLTDHGRELLAAATVQECRSSEALLPYVSETRLVPAARLLRQLRALLAGNGSPPAEAAAEHPVRERARAFPKRAHRSKVERAPADLPPSPEPIEPEEGEFPVNLL